MMPLLGQTRYQGVMTKFASESRPHDLPLTRHASPRDEIEDLILAHVVPSSVKIAVSLERDWPFANENGHLLELKVEGWPLQARHWRNSASRGRSAETLRRCQGSGWALSHERNLRCETVVTDPNFTNDDAQIWFACDERNLIQLALSESQRRASFRPLPAS